MSNSVTMCQTLDDIQRVIISLGLKFKEVSEHPTERQKQKADTVYFISEKNVSSMHYPQIPRPALGRISFGGKAMYIAPGTINKFGLKGFLFRSTKCGVSFCDSDALYQTAGCNTCGLIMCEICVFKLLLAAFDESLYIPAVMVKCPKCRSPSRMGIVERLSTFFNYQDKFTQSEKDKVDYIMRRWQIKCDRPNLMKEMKQATAELAEKLDQSKCAFCKTKFIQKRSNCGGCRKVSYCNKQCQVKHWKRHKSDCKLFRTYNDNQ